MLNDMLVDFRYYIQHFRYANLPLPNIRAGRHTHWPTHIIPYRIILHTLHHIVLFLFFFASYCFVFYFLSLISLFALIVFVFVLIQSRLEALNYYGIDNTLNVQYASKRNIIDVINVIVIDVNIVIILINVT